MSMEAVPSSAVFPIMHAVVRRGTRATTVAKCPALVISKERV